ncbi:uncharacterized protein LOC129731895 isoform X2 [Wyeomyia smithii]|uniref:uncharacterized protein LOC129731895 isoform X2 n=1 Tax=Wyeomyia smithii TaxID=174621 RepID=UPI002467CC29|nr:uncharacterized protein LOC129731895 isoform X2 [Wyeomyia smithii]
MEDLEKRKENIKPLRGGRNVNQLKIALTSDSQFEKEKRFFEEKIEKYSGSDPLQPWYEYICWIEQTFVTKTNHASLNNILLHCIAKFEKVERYQQDRRFVKLCIKYIDTQSSPQELYEELYERGIGTLCAELYIAWAYYFDSEDNFDQTEAIYQKGFDAGASPREDLSLAHKQFSFSMSQRLLHKDESSKQMFKLSFAEKRHALTSLKMQNTGTIGSLRTGIALRHNMPGVVNQETDLYNATHSTSVYSQENKGSALLNKSNTTYLVNSNRNRENICEPGPWSNKKNKRGPLFGKHNELSFYIALDFSNQITCLKEDNLCKGIQLSPNHKRHNNPQRQFVITACDDDKPSGFPMYDKICLYCRAPAEDFSPEECYGYQYIKRHGINLQFFKQYKDIWDNGYHVKIRLHPYHVREYECKSSILQTMICEEALQANKCTGNPLDNEQYSIEEQLFRKWKDDRAKHHVSNHHSDGMLGVHIDETIIEPKRVSIALQKDSTNLMDTSCGLETKLSTKSHQPELNQEKHNQFDQIAIQNNNSFDVNYFGAISELDTHKRLNTRSPGKLNMNTKAHQIEALAGSGQMLIKATTPTDTDKAKWKNKTSIKPDNDRTSQNKDSFSYYPNDLCSAQIFSMFLKCQSTPLKRNNTTLTEISIPRQCSKYEVSDLPAKFHAKPEHQKTTDLICISKQLSTIMERSETSAMSVACGSKFHESPQNNSAVEAITAVPNQSTEHIDNTMNETVITEVEPMIQTNNQMLPNEPNKKTQFSCQNFNENIQQKSIRPVNVKPSVESVNFFETHYEGSELLEKINAFPEQVSDVNELSKSNDNTDSYVQQCDHSINSLLSCKVSTENTDNIALPFVKLGEINNLGRPCSQLNNDKSVNKIFTETLTSEAKKTSIDESCLNIHYADIKNSSSFDLVDCLRTPQKCDLRTCDRSLLVAHIKTSHNIDSPSRLLKIKNVVGAMNVVELHSHDIWGSTEDMNTEIFSMNMNNIINSTLLPILPSTKQDNSKCFSYPQALNEDNVARTAYINNKTLTPILHAESAIELEYEDLSKSIYFKRLPSSVEVKQKWDEIDENFNPCNNQYLKKEIDLDETMQFIYQQTREAEIDPFETKLKAAFLEQINFMNYIEELSTCSLVNKIQPLSKGMVEDVHGTKFSVIRKIGEGTFGTVYCAKKMSTGEVVAMKQERPANLWEYYICLELKSRINHVDILSGFMSVDYAIIGNNASILISRLSPFDHLHSCMIIHADIKPDNFLLMKPLSLGCSTLSVQLIDFGVSIDLKLFPKKTAFKKVVKTESFTCIEMLENRPWTFQPDLYGVAGTTHVMLFGRYMEVQKDMDNWYIKTRMPRYFRKNLWDNYFSTLLNIRDCEVMPNLQTLRNMLLSEINDNSKYFREKLNEFNQTLLSL